MEELDYVETGIQASVSVVVASLFLLIDFSNPWTLAPLLLVPVLFGYTAYRSREEFRKESLASGIMLFYIPLGVFTAVSVISVFLVNVLTSFVSSRDSFRAYYSTTSTPLILTGLILGTGLTALMAVDPGIEADIEASSIDKVSEVSVRGLELAGMTEGGFEENEHLIHAAEDTVVDHYSENAEDPEIDVVEEGFDEAREDIYDGMEIREEIEEMVQGLIGGRMLLIAVPGSILVLYAFQPFVGLLTAIYATAIRKIEGLYQG